MRSSTRFPGRAPTLLLGALLWLACSPPQNPAAPPDAAYTVRGEVARLPGNASAEIWIQHEAIPEFQNERGERVGMESMTMPFPVAAGIDLAGLAAGDRIEFDFEVRWRGTGRPLAITRVEPLPRGTRLAFDPPAAAEERDAAQPTPTAGETPQ